VGPNNQCTFQVYNLTNYPHLVGFLEVLGVDTEPSDMSFALSIDGGSFEWASLGLGTIFPRYRDLFNPSLWRMLADVIRFGWQAPEVLRPENVHIYEKMCLEEYLKRRGYSPAFTQNYILPMSAAIWSVSNSLVRGGRTPVA
jgi:predicted NAD/FAD-binding protein